MCKVFKRMPFSPKRETVALIYFKNTMLHIINEILFEHYSDKPVVKIGVGVLWL